jgi:RNA polymerase sigma-70 factor (ECF subfamily)
MSKIMTFDDPDTEELVARAGQGDTAARQELLERHRDRLRKMVAVRLDRRLAARVDPSDVVQEVMLEAAQGLAQYWAERPLPFYPWLRRLAWKRLLKLYQHHLAAQKRAVGREQPGLPLADESVLDFAGRFVAPGTSPSNRLVREELCARVRDALDALSEADREVLVLRFLEQLSTAETAAVLGTTEGAVKTRQTRALDRLCRLLGTDPRGSDA